MAKQISLVYILKNSAKFNLVSLTANILSLPKAIIIAMIIGPKDYGVISFLGLWSLYATFINPGLLAARGREMAHLLGNGKEEKAVYLQNVAQTSDMVYSLIPLVVMLSASFFFSERLIRTGLIITAFSYVATRILNYWRGVNFTRQKFGIVAKADLMNSVFTVVFIVTLIFWLKVYAVLSAPILAAMITLFYYLRRGAINFRFAFDWPKTVQLFKIGIFFSMLAFAYWGFQLIDKTVIANFLPLEDLGIYSYAVSFVFLAMMFLRDFGNVFAPVLWTSAGNTKDYLETFRDTKRAIIYMAIITATLIPLSHTCFYLVVELLTKKYIASIPVFIILSCNLYITILAIIPTLILQSSVINKQATLLPVYIVAMILNAIFEITAIRMGYGIIGVAWITVLSQAIVTFFIFYLARKYIFENRRDANGFISAALFPFLIGAAFCLAHVHLMRVVSSPWIFAGTSIALQIIVWAAVLGGFYREYISRETIARFIKEIAASINKKAPLKAAPELSMGEDDE